MRTVRDQSGVHYVLLEAGKSDCLVRAIRSGEATTRPCAELQPVAPETALAAVGIDTDDAEALAVSIRLDRAVGLLIELDAAGPLAVRTLLDRFDVCESDLHGMVTELRAAGLLEPTTVYGERGYRITETASDALTTSER